jgi:hypothetical protein
MAKRQAEEVAVHLSRDCDAFYAQALASPQTAADAGKLVVISADLSAYLEFHFEQEHKRNYPRPHLNFSRRPNPATEGAWCGREFSGRANRAHRLKAPNKWNRGQLLQGSPSRHSNRPNAASWLLACTRL